jgi:hypothetical protein
MIDRRNALKLALGSAAALAAPSVLGQTPARPRSRVVFLGTKGGPRVGVGASNPANLVLVNDMPFVVDCGMGVSRQLVIAGVPIPSIKYIFITITIPIIISNTAICSTTPGPPVSRHRSTRSARRASKR